VVSALVPLVLVIHAAATWAMTGLIWFVQVVHYPLLSAVGASGFAAYHAAHSRLTTLVVGPLMLVEAAGAIWIVMERPSSLAWTGVALLAVVAFAATFLRRPSKALSYATDAILPIYLMHQTVLVVAADVIVPQRWPLVLEMPVLVALTLLVPLAIYHVLVRPFVVSRVLFGLRPHARPTAPKDDTPHIDAKPLHS